MNIIKVVIVDDMMDINNYFRILMSREKDIEVVGMAESSEEGFKLISNLQPDIVLTDIEMETPEAGITMIKKLKALYSQIKFIVLTIHEEDSILFKSFEAGAEDYIVKTASASNILESIRAVHDNHIRINHDIMKKLLNEFCRMKNEQEKIKNSLNMVMQLTKSEYEILKDMYYGKTYKQIAMKRFVEEITIRTQGANIIRKFNRKRIKEVLEDLKEMKFFDACE